jgi:2-polyprenyl-6-methoxyphenol hydroxylase-like FAD-dependent oxidoreductase
VLLRPSWANPAKKVKASYLVGADGGRSFVRRTLGIEFPGKTLGVRAVVADVVVTGVGRDAWHRFNSGSMETQIALCPLHGTEMFSLQAPIPGDIVDDGEHIREGYGVQPGNWVLVRPDGYVGAIVAADSVAALEGYLGGVGVTAG